MVVGMPAVQQHRDVMEPMEEDDRLLLKGQEGRVEQLRHLGVDEEPDPQPLRAARRAELRERAGSAPAEAEALRGSRSGALERTGPPLVYQSEPRVPSVEPPQTVKMNPPSSLRG